MATCGELLVTCPECGAIRVNGMDCWEQLGAVLAWEWQDAELSALHFVTVASYNLQHPSQLTDEALAGLRTAYADHLDRGTAVSYIRARANAAAAGRRRVKKPRADRHPVLRRFDMTIADVYQPEHPEGAADRVRAWAAAIRRAL
jgi:hypothetical protein